MKMSSLTSENGLTNHYKYDSFGRLAEIRNSEKYVVTEKNYYFSLDYNTNFNPSDPNYVEDKQYVNGDYVDPQITRVFYDGLGREIQTRISNSYMSGSNFADIVTAKEYDEMGREKKVFKPYYDISGSQTAFTLPSNLLAEAQIWYNGSNGANCSSYPYTQTEYYPDPLSRIKKIGNPGSVYRLGAGNEIELEYGANSYSDVSRYSSANLLFKKNMTLNLRKLLSISTQLSFEACRIVN